MPRPLRQDFPGAVHHVMNRGSAGRTIFVFDADRLLFLRCLEEAVAFAELDILAYCLMGNHYHLLLRSCRGRLPHGMQRLSGKFTSILNKRDGVDGPRFRGRYASVLVETDAHLLQATRYIHLNPVEAKLVVGPSDWKWSSHAIYSGDSKTAPVKVQTDVVLDMFGAAGRRQRYREFINAGLDSQTKAFYQEIWK